ncbi:MAG: T9SS type A sorting domain-containing protein [Calditrichota bacterium]
MRFAPVLLILMLQVVTAQTIIEDQPPRIGQDYSVTVTPPGSADWSFNLICYRRGGEETFTIVPLQEAGTAFRAVIPAEFMTEQGVEFFVSFSDLATTVNVPPGSSEENPAILRVNANEYITTRISLPINTYRMVSVPLQLRNSSPEEVLVDDLGPYDAEKWRLFRWINGEFTGYSEFPQIPSNFTPGTAFWLISEDGGFFDVDSGLTLDSSQPEFVPITSGWNQIGNPFAFNFPWNEVQFESPIQGPYFFDGTEYVIADTLQPWNGYFIFTNTAQILTFIPRDNEGEKRSLQNTDPIYALNLKMTTDKHYRDSYNRVGWSMDGAEVILQEPPAVTQNVRLSIMKEGIPLMQQLRGDKPYRGSWRLEIEAPDEKVNAVIDLEHQSKLPSEIDIYILDPINRKALLDAESEYLQLSLKAGEKRELKLIIGDSDWAQKQGDGIPLRPTEFNLAQNYPNPFNPETTIRYRLSQQEMVTLEIFNLLGQKVRTLVNQVEDTGEYSVRWDGRDTNGYSTASGVYLYRLRAGEFTATRKMMLIR